ncbi:MAG: STAS domain-containing protein [Candidatus Krumholzibacteriia bacterium]
MRSFDYRIRIGANRIAVVSLEGDVDSLTSLKLSEAIDSILQQGIHHIVVDLAHVGYINSAGWGVLLSKLKEMRHPQGGFRLAEMAPDVHEVFATLGIGEVIEAHDSTEEAVCAFEADLAKTKRGS